MGEFNLFMTVMHCFVLLIFKGMSILLKTQLKEKTL